VPSSPESCSEFAKESCGDSKIEWPTRSRVRSAGIQRAHVSYSRAVSRQCGRRSPANLYDRRTAPDGRAHMYARVFGEHDTRFRRTGRLAKVAGGTGERGPRKPPLGARANRRWLLSWPLVTHTPTPPHVAFPKAPPHDSSQQKARKGDSPLFQRVNSNGFNRSSVGRLLHRRTARDVRHREWARSLSCEATTPTFIRLTLVTEPATGSRERARASLAVLRWCSSGSPGGLVPVADDEGVHSFFSFECRSVVLRCLPRFERADADSPVGAAVFDCAGCHVRRVAAFA